MPRSRRRSRGWEALPTWCAARTSKTSQPTHALKHATPSTPRRHRWLLSPLHASSLLLMPRNRSWLDGAQAPGCGKVTAEYDKVRQSTTSSTSTQKANYFAHNQRSSSTSASACPRSPQTDPIHRSLKWTAARISGWRAIAATSGATCTCAEAAVNNRWATRGTARKILIRCTTTAATRRRMTTTTRWKC